MKLLLIQTAFTGDVILATPLIERLKQEHPDCTIHFLARKGNEALLENHPHLAKTLVFDKSSGKFRNLLRLARQVRAEKYDTVINLHRFFSSGLLTVLSGAKVKIGFDKNPLSFLFTRSFKHIISQNSGQHETERNLSLLKGITDTKCTMPKLYPSAGDFQKVFTREPYVCIAPASVWFTKQLPAEKWCELIQQLPAQYKVYLIGAPGDAALCQKIQQQSNSARVEILAGKLSLLQSAALLKNARMTYTNDSAPLHLASAMNAPVTAFFCSTVPAFGFGPLSDNARIFETETKLDCRPCGLHGKKQCPRGHFKCADINMSSAANIA